MPADVQNSSFIASLDISTSTSQMTMSQFHLPNVIELIP